jgi:hypothetical protein
LTIGDPALFIGALCQLGNRSKEDREKIGLILLLKQNDEMKSAGNKKLIIQMLSVGLVRLLFVSVMILMVSIASNLSCQKLNPMPDDNLATTKFMSSLPMLSFCSPNLDKVRDEIPLTANVTNFQPISNIDSQKSKLVLSENPVHPNIMNSQPKEEDHTLAEIEHRLTPVDSNEPGRLFHPVIIKTSIRYQIDPALVKAIIMAESGFNSRAISKNGAIGLMQLMPETAQELNVEDIFNPEQNIDGGVRYFKQLVNQFSGDLKLALAAYNAGSKTVRQFKGIPPFKETQDYIEKVFKYYQFYKNQKKEIVDGA